MARILLVEDHDEIREFLSRRLRRRGHEVMIACDGLEALHAVSGARPDVVLLDMNMPVMDGWTTARSLRADPAMPRVPIIALTAAAASGDRERAIGAGCDDYHPKPVDLARLLGQVEAQLRI